MKKLTHRKLALHTETLRQLDDTTLTAAVGGGGGGSTNPTCPSAICFPATFVCLTELCATKLCTIKA